MDTWSVLFIIACYAAIAGILVYLIVKRIADRGREDFEKRDN